MYYKCCCLEDFSNPSRERGRCVQNVSKRRCDGQIAPEKLGELITGKKSACFLPKHISETVTARGFVYHHDAARNLAPNNNTCFGYSRGLAWKRGNSMLVVGLKILYFVGKFYVMQVRRVNLNTQNECRRTRFLHM